MRVSCSGGSCGADAELCSPAGALIGAGTLLSWPGDWGRVPHAQHSLHMSRYCVQFGALTPGKALTDWKAREGPRMAGTGELSLRGKATGAGLGQPGAGKALGTLHIQPLPVRLLSQASLSQGER